MKQKMVIRVQNNCEKCQTKAMETAATAAGVISVAIQGKENNELVVTGNDVDVVALTKSLRKRLRSAVVMSVSAVEDPKPKPEPKPDPKPKKDEEPPAQPPIVYCQYPCYSSPYPCPSIYYVPDYPSPSICSIM